jgi:hypothetical protein
MRGRSATIAATSTYGKFGGLTLPRVWPAPRITAEEPSKF